MIGDSPMGVYIVHGQNARSRTRVEKKMNDRERERECVNELERKGSEKERELIKLLTVIKHEKKKVECCTI